MDHLSFAGRYGKADPAGTMHWPVTLLYRYNRSVGRWLEKEHEALERSQRHEE